MDPLKALEQAERAAEIKDPMLEDVLRGLGHLLAYYQWRVRGGYRPDARADARAEEIAYRLLDVLADGTWSRDDRRGPEEG